MSDQRLIYELKPNRQIGVVTWLILAFLAYGICHMFFVGSRENKKFRDECLRQGLDSLKGPSNDDDTRRIVADCDSKLKEYGRR
jgi:hypothetical protein